MQKKAKKVTLESLAAALEAGFERMDKGFKKGFKEAKEDNESLARMVADGFEHTAKDILSLTTEVSVLKDGVVTLEQGQENIIARLDNLAPQFEVKQLERRVKRLEDRAGILHPL